MSRYALTALSDSEEYETFDSRVNSMRERYNRPRYLNHRTVDSNYVFTRRVTIVHPDTLHRWFGESRKPGWKKTVKKTPANQRGNPQANHRLNRYAIHFHQSCSFNPPKNEYLISHNCSCRVNLNNERK